MVGYKKGVSGMKCPNILLEVGKWELISLMGGENTENCEIWVTVLLSLWQRMGFIFLNAMGKINKWDIV